MSDKQNMNLEQTVQWLVDVADSKIKPTKWLYYDEFIASYITEPNVGNYYIVYKDATNYLYYVTKRNNDGLTGINLGKWPAVGTQGVPGQKGDTPVITISNNNTWVVDGVDTGKTSRGIQGVQGPRGESGFPGAGVGTVTDIDTSEYTPTVDESGETYAVYTTNADIKYEVAGEEQTDTVEIVYKVRKAEGVPENIIELADCFEVGGSNDVIFTGGETEFRGGIIVDNDANFQGNKLLIDGLDQIQDEDGNELLNTALDTKVTRVVLPRRVYGTDYQGEQTTIEYGGSTQVGKLAQYVNGGTAQTPVPCLYTTTPGTATTGDSNKYFATSVDFNNRNYVQKTTTASRVYTTGSDGSQTTRGVSYNPSAYDIPAWNANGQLTTNAPTSDLHCATKKYVDDAVAGGGGGGATLYNHFLTLSWNLTGGQAAVAYMTITNSNPNKICGASGSNPDALHEYIMGTTDKEAAYLAGSRSVSATGYTYIDSSSYPTEICDVTFKADTDDGETYYWCVYLETPYGDYTYAENANFGHAFEEVVQC